MNIEELKLVIQLIEQLSGNATTAFMVYIVVVKVFLPILCWCGVLTLVLIVGKTVQNIINSTVRTSSYFKEVQKSIDGYSSYLSDSDIKEISLYLDKARDYYDKYDKDNKE
jgi:hypothetical protein